jgi:hypothetical protein
MRQYNWLRHPQKSKDDKRQTKTTQLISKYSGPLKIFHKLIGQWDWGGMGEDEVGFSLGLMATISTKKPKCVFVCPLPLFETEIVQAKRATRKDPGGSEFLVEQKGRPARLCVNVGLVLCALPPPLCIILISKRTASTNKILHEDTVSTNNK